MTRYSQVFSRIGFGLAAMGALIWMFWPDSFASVLDPESIFAFVTSFVLWVIAEFKQSEALILTEPSENDLGVAGEVLREHSGDLRWLLKDTDLWSFVDSEFYSKVIRMYDRHERDEIFFHDEKLNQKLNSFFAKLGAFLSHISLNTTPEQVGGSMMTGFKPISVVPDDEYERRRQLALEANDLASDAWMSFDELAKAIRQRMPSALPTEQVL